MKPLDVLVGHCPVVVAIAEEHQRADDLERGHQHGVAPELGRLQLRHPELSDPVDEMVDDSWRLDEPWSVVVRTLKFENRGPL